RNQCKQAVSDPLIVEHRGVFVSPLEGVAPQVEELWCAQLVEGFQPDSKPVRALLEEMNLPVFISQCHQVTVIAPVKETLARVFLHLSLEKGQQVVPVDVNLEVLAAGLVPLLKFFYDVGITGGGNERRQHVGVGEDLI